MRLGTVMLCGPSGQQVNLEATDDGELIIETHPSGGFTLIRDTGLPPHKAKNKEGEDVDVPRVVAQVPGTWAVFPGWHVDSPT